jgi:hypothetical protein
MSSVYRRIRDVVHDHPYLVLGGGGAVLGGGLEGIRAHIENKISNHGRDEEWKDRYKGIQRNKVLRRALSGALTGGMTGLYAAAKLDEAGVWQQSPASRAREGQRAAEAAKKARWRETSKTYPHWARDVRTQEEAKTRMRAEAMKHHPDRGGDSEKMKEVNRAWEEWTGNPYSNFHDLPKGHKVKAPTKAESSVFDRISNHFKNKSSPKPSAKPSQTHGPTKLLKASSAVNIEALALETLALMHLAVQE